MQDEYIKISQIIMRFIKQLSDAQYQTLLEGHGRLVFQEKKERKQPEKPMNEDLVQSYKTKINAFETHDQVYKYLMSLKKKELVQMSDALNVRILSSDTKSKISNKIIDLVLGMKFRKQLFDEIKAAR